MKTVGTMFREARMAKGITLEQAESITRIRKKFLLAMESDNFSSLPSVTYAKGFVKNYSTYLALDSAVMLAFFRRQMEDKSSGSVMPKGMSDPFNTPFFSLTPARFIAVLIVGLVGLFLLYFFFQYKRLDRPPILIVDQPQNESIATEKKIDIIGSTDNDATITINGISVLVRQDGKFFDQVSLESGVNTITIVATSRFGKSTTVIRKVGFMQ